MRIPSTILFVKLFFFAMGVATVFQDDLFRLFLIFILYVGMDILFLENNLPKEEVAKK